jgi:asparagine synthase (glutamine-hydrolysing)
VCGVFGYVSRKAGKTVDLAHLYSALRHRGPDAAQACVFQSLDGPPRQVGMEGEVEGRIILAQVRLSIIDVSEAGTQPFTSEDGRYVLCYNGEVYNYIELRETLEQAGWKFRTRTDTEVLLKAWMHWGEACLDRLIGMFAFILLDRQAGRIFAVRDAFGIKPLYLCELPDGLAMCSDYMALAHFVDSSKTDLRATNTAFFLRYGITQFGADTLLEGIGKVELGEVVEMDAATGAIRDRRRFFDMTSIEQQDWDFADARRALRDTFLKSVELHMRSDVPYAATLSGGIDSSSIVCAMREVSNAPVHTFSFHAATKEISETRWIDIVNAHIGAVAHPVRPSQMDFHSSLENLVRYQGEPFGSLSIFASYSVQQTIAEAGFKVVLSGQGADEIVSGYTHFLADYAVGLLKRGRLGEFWRWCRSAVAQTEGVSMRVLLSQVAERQMGAGTVDLLRRLDRKPHFQPWVRSQGVRGQTAAIVQFKQREPFQGSYLRGALVHSLFSGPLADLLRYEDRNAMAHSIENRVPFLTPQMVRLSLSMPDAFLVSKTGTTKYILREAMRGIVPDAILDRPDKIGFAPDNSVWLEKSHVAGLVQEAWRPQLEQFLDKDAFLEGIEKADLSERRVADSIWRTLNLILFMRNVMPEEAV